MDPVNRPPAAPAGPELTLDPRTYAVFIRVPLMWWNEAETITEIAGTLRETRASVRLRLAHLINVRLVERRRRQTISPTVEVRRVGK